MEVKDLDVAYGESKVLFQVSLTVKSGEVVALVGRNGAGKTTLFRTIAGFLKPMSGSISFNGRNIVGLLPYEIARLGIRYVHQDKRVFSKLTVKENLELASYATGDHDLDRVLDYFPKLKTLLNRKGGFLSGGERQMLMVARALVGQPALLLLDEPTEGLAPLIIESLTDTFKRLREKSTLVIVAQNLRTISDLADRVYVMKEGRVIHEVTDREDIKNITFEKYL